MTNFQLICERVEEVLAEYRGSFLERFMHHAAGEDLCEILLVKSSGRGEVTVFLEGIRHLSVGNSVSVEGGALVDDIRVVHLSSDGAEWPPGVEKFVRPFPGLPELVWIRIIGPVEVNVIASLIGLSVAIDLGVEQ